MSGEKTAMSTETANLLLEIGTEELPPKALLQLIRALESSIVEGLHHNQLAHGEVCPFATPRRLALTVSNLQLQADDQKIELLGPPAERARDADGSWSKAALGFARKNNVEPDALQVVESAKGPRLAYRDTVAGQRAEDCLEAIVDAAIRALPIPRRMRWGAGRTEFVRPVHWVIMMLDDGVVECEILGRNAGRTTRGHRFHSSGPLEIGQALEYREILRAAKVVASFAERRDSIARQVEEQAARLGAHAVVDPDLLDEVTALVEWPVALTGSFEERFLEVPAEALVLSMKEHQKYFHLVDEKGDLLPHFITIANIESTDPAQVIDGNERVIRPRLSDADFFYTTDRKIPLADRVAPLANIVFQKELGTLLDKTQRLAALAGALATPLGSDETLARRAAELSKTDLVTDLVGEFADLQGVAGRYYALHDGEDAQVAAALEQQYWPRYAGDNLPDNPIATGLALADRLDTLVGIFGIGQQPTGSRDPFALRRASLGVLRILVEGELELDLLDCLRWSYAQYPPGLLAATTVDDVAAYMLERFRAWYEDDNIPAEVFKAVTAKQLTTPLDIHRRVHAVAAFAQLPEAASLAAANKRVSNILAKQGPDFKAKDVSEDLLTDAAEKALATALADRRHIAEALLTRGQYSEALTCLAVLQQPVDAFFDEVMVMADDPAVRDNRLSLLANLRDLFLQVADISQLVVSK
jgi:glycyl-tRNA synthetase beta chain